MIDGYSLITAAVRDLLHAFVAAINLLVEVLRTSVAPLFSARPHRV